jgi:hypothetical protein
VNDSSVAASESEPTIAFRFKADRFGFRSTALRNDVAFARNVIDAVDDWTHTVEELFGDVGIALNVAREARILPMHPTLSAVNQFRNDVRGQLEAAGPSASSLDSNARFAVEELRLYLIDLSDWAETFQAGVWAATVAGCCSHEPDGSTRRLQGLRAVALVYDFDKTIRAEEARDELKKLRSWAGKVLPTGLATVASMGERFTIPPKYFGEFAEAASEQEQSRIHEWLKRMREDAWGMADDLSAAMSEPVWQEIEMEFWRQWRWQPNVAVRDSDIPKVTILDLMHTTRHANIPVVPARGGYLSIGEWSRILDLAARAGHVIPEHAIDAAEKTLAVPIFRIVPAVFEEGQDLVAVIRPRSSRSTAWAWQPQQGLHAIALMPNDVAAADRTIEDSRLPPEEAEHPIEDALFGMKSDTRVEILEFVELGGDTSVAASHSRRRRMASDQVFFGTGAAPVGADHYVQSPAHIRDLLDRAQAAYPHLFPVPPPPKRPVRDYILMPWLAFWDQIRFGVALARRWTVRLFRRSSTRLAARIRSVSRRLAALRPFR